MAILKGWRWRGLVLACLVVTQITGSGTTGLPQSCVRSHGYWKNHSSSWPVRTLYLGDPAKPLHRYSEPALMSLLGLSPKGDASVILAMQLIAAKLNIANGARSAAADAAIARADRLLAVFNQKLPYKIKSSTPVGASMTSTAEVLDDFNNGRLKCTCAGANKAPTANAGLDQTAPVGALVRLSGAASTDPNGDALKFTWTLVARPAGSAASLTGATTIAPKFVVDRAGLYVIKLIVNDGHLASAPDTVVISTGNSAPVAHAGADQTRHVGDVVRLDGSASADADGDQLAFFWTFVERPAASHAAFDDAGSVTPTFAIDAPGTYVAQLVVRDATSASEPDVVAISTINSPPTANAGPDTTAGVGDTVTLSGAASSDVDGDPLQFMWSIVSRPAGSNAAFADSTVVQPTFAIDRAGDYVIQLVTSDGFASSLPDSVTVSTVNSRPSANAGADQSVFVGTPAQLDGSGSSDPDGNTLTYAWSLIARPEGSAAALTNPTAVNPTLIADLPGTYIAQLVVDDGALTSDPDSVQLTTGNRPPIADPGVAQTVPFGSTVVLDGTASSDPDGDAISYLWSLLSTPQGSAAQLVGGDTAQPSFVVDVRGEFVAQLIVSDAAAQSAPRTVTISTENSAPIANAGPDQTVSIDDTIQLDGSASIDPDGTPLQYFWSFQSLPAGSQATLSDPASASATFAPDLPGAYVAQLLVSDGILISAADSVIVTVTDAADLVVAFGNPPSGALAIGSAVSFQVSVQNLGPLDAHAVAAVFQLASGYSGTVTPSTGAYEAATGAWSIGDLASGATGFLSIEAVIQATGSLDLASTITNSDRTDPDLANNTASVTGLSRLASANRTPGITSTPPTEAAVGIEYAYDIIAVDPDAGDAITFLLPVSPQGMSVDGAGHIRWTPQGAHAGPVNVAIHVRDQAGHVAVQSFTIQVAIGASNQAPTAADDRFEARTGESLGIASPGVLANDNDPDGNRLSARLVSQPANGTAILNADGSLIYTPFTFQPGEIVAADHVNLVAALEGNIPAASSVWFPASSAFDSNLYSSWVSSPGNTSFFGYSSNQLPYVEITFPQDVAPTELQVLGNRTSSTKASAGRFQMFDADGAELFDSDIIDLPAPSRDGTVAVPDLFNRRRNAARDAGAIYRASSFQINSEPFRAFDGSIIGAGWNASIGAPQFIEVEMPAAITLHQVNVFGNRSSSTSDFLTYIVQAFSADGQPLFDSGPIVVTAASSDQRVPVPDISGVRRVRVTGTVQQSGGGAGFAEIEVMATEPSTVRLNGRVRRVRFTVTADEATSNQVGVAEIRVMGSTPITRAARVEPNLARLIPTLVRASSIGAGNIPESAIDETVRNWFAVTQDAGEFIELEFASPVTVTGIDTTIPSGTPGGFGSSLPINCSGSFTLFAADGTTVFTTAVANQPSGTVVSSATPFAWSIPGVAAVKRVRFTSAGCSGSWPVGFNEIRVFGASDIEVTPIVAIKKYQAVFGREVHSTPVVINLTDDNHDGAVDHRDIPEIVVAVEDTANQLLGVLKVVSGDDGRELMTMGSPNLVSPWAEPAAADLDGDGVPEVIAVHSDRNHLIAFNADGTVKWTSDAHAMPQFALGSGVATGAVSIANLDGAGAPEIIVGASVFDAQGHLLADGRAIGGQTGGLGQRSAMSAVADIDLDGVPELVAGATVYRFNGTLSQVWQRSDRADGYVAIANLDEDPFAEIVVVANGTVYVMNHDGTDSALWNSPSHGPIAIPGGGQGGAPTIADVDADGVPEIGVAGASNYVVFNRDGSIRWQQVISDRTSNATGATVFDLDNDGSAEIIYRDEAHLRIFRGRDGVQLSKTPIGSSTWSEMPVVADVDNDGHADLVVTSDRFFDGNNQADTGVYVFTDVANRWARTRRIWNQNSYHVTNIDEDGRVPVDEQEHWLLPGLNAFRLNRLQTDQADEGSDSFEYVVNDGAMDSDRAVINVAIRVPNSAPRFTSSALTSAATGVAYFYAPAVGDPDDGDILTFSLPESPVGMSIDESSGLVRWTPSPGQVGPHAVTIKVRDIRGLFALQRYTIVVGNPISVPNVVGQEQGAAATAVVNAALTVGTISMRHSAAVAAGLVLDQTAAAGTPVAAATAIALVVSSGPQPTGTVPNVVGLQQSTASNDIVASGFTLGAVIGAFNNTIAAGIVLSQTPAAGVTANAGAMIALVVSSGVPPADRDEDHDGFTGAQGDCNDTNAAINPLAIDVPGDGIDQNCNGRDSIGGDISAPVAAIASPDDLATVTMPTDIIGTATDDNFLRYTVQMAEVDAATFTTIGSGSAPATNAVVGRIDPTLLENGLYRVRLVVEDVNGQTAIDERVYRVDGHAKVGAYRLSYDDLRVPVAGIPITVTRTYDSRVKVQRDFGVGWTLGVRTGTYRNNRVPGEGWLIRDLPFLGQFLPCIGGSFETRTHLTEVRLSETEWYSFALDISNGNLGVTGACEGTASFQFVDGSTPGATLTMVDPAGVIYLRGGDDVLLDMNAFLEGETRVFDPRRVRLTRPDGVQVELERTSGVTRVIDLDANELRISPNGVTHSSGKSISFARDERGRIIRITAPRGETLRYAYDDAGDLTTFADQAGADTTFTYDGRHNLIGIEDALGRTSRSEFDSDGRLVAVIDPGGHRSVFEHDIDNRTETITNRLGERTTLEYDLRGNITRRVDALGNPTLFTFDGRDNLLTETDPLGHTQTFTYDEQDNVVSSTNAMGATTTRTFNAHNQLLTVTDALGRTTSTVYDSRDRITRATAADGGETSYLYDSRGNPSTTINPVGARWDYTYDGHGQPTRVETPAHQVRQTTYDPNGNALGETRTVRIDGASAAASTTFEYDALNRRTKIVNAVGAEHAVTFTLTGQVATQTAATGAVTQFAYDDQDRLVRTTHPDGTVDSVTYDAEGRARTRTDRAGRTTSYSYDALGRLLSTRLPDGSVKSTSYDAAGRVHRSTDELGRSTEYSYDAEGRLTETRDALGVRRLMTYDAVGNLTSESDGHGHVTSFEYDAENRRTRTIFADGSSIRETFDAAGRQIATTDAAGNITRYEYDGRGALARVVDPLGSATTYVYGELDRLASRTSPLGHLTRFDRDVVGRLIRTTLPLGQVETRAYDVAGRLTTIRDYNGDSISHAYDSMSRLISRQLPSGEVERFAYTPMGLMASYENASGITRIEYDERDRPVLLRQPDGAEVRYAYDATGNRISLVTPGGTQSFDYDALNRLTRFTDPGGLQYDFGYDVEGNLTQLVYGNGIRAEYRYDARDRVTDLIYTRQSSVIRSFQYALGAVGNRTRLLEDDGRVTDYTYDALFRLTGETVTRPGQAPVTSSYTYDADGNRASQTSAAGTVTYTYDANSRLRQVGARTLNYDHNGNLVGVTDVGGTTTNQYDAHNRLVRSASPAGVAQYTYDALGRRVTMTNAAGTTQYLNEPFGAGHLSRVVRESSASGSTDYAYAGTTLVSMRRGSSSSIYIADGHSSTRMLVDLTGNITDRYDYDAFGNVLAHDGTTLNAYLFDGEELDSNLRLYNLRARHYDPVAGRFITRDPHPGMAFDPGSLHPYTFAHGDPVNRSDPSGEFSLMEQMTVAASVGILAGTSYAVSTYATYGSADLAFEVGVDAAFTFGGLALDAIGAGPLFRAVGQAIVKGVVKVVGSTVVVRSVRNQGRTIASRLFNTLDNVLCRTNSVGQCAVAAEKEIDALARGLIEGIEASSEAAARKGLSGMTIVSRESREMLRDLKQVLVESTGNAVKKVGEKIGRNFGKTGGG